MEHMTDKIAEFVFGDLSASETSSAKQHLADCSDCRLEVEAFQHTHAILRMSPDVEPPRRILFEASRPAAKTWIWQWLSPAGAAIAASLLTAVLMRPEVQPGPPQPAEPAIVRLQPAPAVQPIDSDRVIAEFRALLTSELRKRDAAQTSELEAVRTQLAYLESLQLAMRRETMQNTMSIVQLAERSEDQE